MDRNVRIGWLLDFYGSLLTDKQRRVLELRWNDDLSLAEIGEVMDMSRQAVNDAVNRGEAHLSRLEEKLGMLRRHAAMSRGLTQCLSMARQAAGSDSSAVSQVLIEKLEEIIGAWEDSDGL